MFRKSLVLVLVLVLFICHSAFTQETYDLASKNFNSKNFEEALEYIETSLESKETSSSYLLRAMINQSLSRNSNANDDFVKAITLDKDYYEAYFQYSEFLFESFEFEKSIASLNFLLNRLAKGETKGIFIKYDTHGQEATQITTLVGMEVDILAKRGLALQKLGRPDAAMVDFNQALDIAETVDNLVNRSLLFVELGEFENARKDLDQSIKLNPSSALAWYNLLIIDPTTELPVVLEGNMDFAPMLSIKALESFDSEDYVSAGKLFEQALRLTPNDPVLLLNAGRLDQRNQDFKLAQAKFTKVINLAPSKSEALYLLGNSYFGQKQYRNAINYYQQYLKTDPTNAQTWFNSGMAFLELEDSENACKCLNRANDLGMDRAAEFLSDYCTIE